MFNWVITEKCQLQHLLNNGFTIADKTPQWDWDGLHIALDSKRIFWSSAKYTDRKIDPYIKNFSYIHYKQYQLLASLGMDDTEVIQVLREISL